MPVVSSFVFLSFASIPRTAFEKISPLLLFGFPTTWIYQQAGVGAIFYSVEGWNLPKAERLKTQTYTLSVFWRKAFMSGVSVWVSNINGYVFLSIPFSSSTMEITCAIRISQIWTTGEIYFADWFALPFPCPFQFSFLPLLSSSILRSINY